jgi:hypothetical protein
MHRSANNIFVIGSEQHFRTTMGPERAQQLVDPMRMACGKALDLTAKSAFVEARTHPTVAFDLTVKALLDFEQVDGVRKAKVRGQHLWVVDETYALRVKKFRAAYRTANAVTTQQQRISLFLPLEGMEPLIYVTVGVRYSELTGLPVEFAAVKYYPGPHGEQQVEWVVDLDELAGGQVNPATPILPLDGAPARSAAVRPRREASRGGEGTS